MEQEALFILAAAGTFAFVYLVTLLVTANVPCKKGLRREDPAGNREATGIGTPLVHWLRLAQGPRPWLDPL